MSILYKARPIGDLHQPDLHLSATEPIPYGPKIDAVESHQLWEAAYRDRFSAQAKIVVDALCASLPGGTLNAILCQMLERHRSLLIVRMFEPAEERAAQLLAAAKAAWSVRMMNPTALRHSGQPLSASEERVCSALEQLAVAIANAESQT